MFSPYLESNLLFESSCSQSKLQIMSKNWKQPIKYWNSKKIGKVFKTVFCSWFCPNKTKFYLNLDEDGNQISFSVIS